MPGLRPGDGLTAAAATCPAHWTAAVATLARQTGDVWLAQDAVQDAVEAALRSWPAVGVPDHPDAWLIVTGRRRAIDRLRRDRRGAEKAELAARLEAPRHEDPPDLQDRELDDQLALVLLCCHPALEVDAQVALTLRVVAGLSPAEVARAFLVPQRTVQQRLVRAKRKIARAGIAFRPPLERDMPDRIAAALAVVYLIFNEGHTATNGDRLLRPDLAGEALRLGRLLGELAPDDAEALGLHALMLLHHARREARLDARGELASLEEQDRRRWDAGAIAEGISVLDRALRQRRPGPYRLRLSVKSRLARCGGGNLQCAGRPSRRRDAGARWLGPTHRRRWRYPHRRIFSRQPRLHGAAQAPADEIGALRSRTTTSIASRRLARRSFERSKEERDASAQDDRRSARVAWIRAVRVSLLLSANAGAGGAPIARRRVPARRPRQPSRALELRRSLTQVKQ